jgi:glucose/arabinose dehydrogenase
VHLLAFLRGTWLAAVARMRTFLVSRALGAAGLVFVLGVPAEAQLRAVTFVSGLSSPIAFEQDPSDPSVQYVAEQRGIIRIVRGGVLQSTPFLDISTLVACCSERGLLGLAFPPDYGATGRFYVNYTRVGDGRVVVARYRRSANPSVAETQGFALVWSTGENSIRHPFTNHNAGCMAFGPDGYLYIAQGDGGSGGDPENNAQNTNELLGKILRIDVSVPDSHPQGFVVPAGNAGLPRPEIWSLGWRNPWKFSFDPPALGGTGAMLVADVGQDGWEEVDYEPAGRAGRNYGWRVREGAHPYTGSTSAALVDPIWEYGHAEGRSITGGYVYRGASLPSMRGRYFFADYVNRRVWSLALRVNGSTGEASPSVASDVIDHTAELGGTSAVGGISAFGIDAGGELYIVNHSGGSILRVAGAPTAPTNVRVIR